MISIINIEDRTKELGGIPWLPIDMVRVNDQVVRLVLFKGEFHWHKHAKEDELFLVIKGQIIIQLKDQPDINLQEGKMVVIPKGIEHCPKSSKTSYVLLFEPFALKKMGD